MDAVSLIAAHEGLRLRVYKDTDGSDTIGYGFHINILTLDQKRMLADNHGNDWANIYRTGITPDEAMTLLSARVGELIDRAKELFPWFINLSETRQAVLIDMMYEMGEGSSSQGTGLLGFKHFLASLAVGDWSAAVQNIMGSHWAKQVPAREENDALLILQG
jgi:GH24 family phage-related lysozyme (muramidase)